MADEEREDDRAGGQRGRGEDRDPDFDRFYTAAFRRLVAQVYAMTGDLAEAEDAVQEAFARAWTRWRRLRDYDDPEAWVRTVAFRIAVSSFRKAVNRLAAHRREAQPRSAPGLDPDHVALVEALRLIPADQRRALVLHHVAGLPVEEVAAQTGVRLGTVKSRLFRGRAALAEHLRPRDDGEPGPAAAADKAGQAPAPRPVSHREEGSVHA